MRCSIGGNLERLKRCRSTYLLAIILSVYSVSFFLPATYLREDRDLIYGFEAFYLGLTWPPVLAMWLANPVFWVGCLFFIYRQWKKAVVLGLLSSFLGGFEVLPFWDSFAVRFGYLLWVSAMVLLAVSAGVLWVQQRCQREGGVQNMRDMIFTSGPLAPAALTHQSTV